MTNPLQRPIHVSGSEKPFGELTAAEVRERADELRAATGWGPTMRVAPVARAWGELAREMERTDAATVAELDAATVERLAEPLWVSRPLL
jgi:hypothetical protein